MKTICFKCQKVLTDEFGQRLASANFDSTTKDKPESTDDTVWAICDVCLNKEGS